MVLTILSVTVFPSATFAQTNKQPGNSPNSSNLFTVIEKENSKRANFLLGDSTVDLKNFDKLNKFPNNSKQARKGWFSRGGWVVIPVAVGLGALIYYLIKMQGDGGILCNDGTISNAQNRQGACSHHGGIAPGH